MYFYPLLCFFRKKMNVPVEIQLYEKFQHHLHSTQSNLLATSLLSSINGHFILSLYVDGEINYHRQLLIRMFLNQQEGEEFKLQGLAHIFVQQ